MTERSCAICGEHYLVPAQVPQRAYRTCSDACLSIRRKRSWTIAACAECGREFRNKTPGKGAKFCSDPCRLAALNRLPRPTKGRGQGFIDKRGHRIVVVWEGAERRVIGEHRLVMERAIGRRLTPMEVVHHINEIPDDNRPMNLWLCTNQAEHMRIHAFTDRLKANQWLLMAGPPPPTR